MEEKIINNTEWELYPYTEVDGILTFNDSGIKSIFDRMEDEKLVDTVFYDGNIKTPEDFLKFMKFGGNRLFVIARKCNPPIVKSADDVGGLVWTNNFCNRRAQLHFCSFNNISAKESVAVGRYVSGYLINLKNSSDEYIFDVLYGFTPETHRAARIWCKKVGYKLAGILPKAVWVASEKKSMSAYIFFIERSE